MRRRGFHFNFPWITLYIAILIPLSTMAYAALPKSLQGGVALWISSPFNITYELGNVSSFFYNYLLVVFIYLFAELYTRNIADMKGRVSLIRNAFLFSVLASYIVSAIVWNFVGLPSSGTSIMAFNVLIFSAFETYDSELIRRMSERRQAQHRALEIISLVFAALVIILSMLFFIYLNENGYWYVHIAGGALFALIYPIYLIKWVRPRLDALEEKLEKDVENDLKRTGIKIEEESEKLEASIKKDIKLKGRKPKQAKNP